MRISLIAPIVDADIQADLSNLARRLVDTGARLRFFLTPDDHDVSHDLETIAPVTVSPLLSYDQDHWLIHTDLFLYVCAGPHPWLDSARERERGTVALYQPQSLATFDPYLSTTIVGKDEEKSRTKSTDSEVHTGSPESSAYDTLLALVPYADLVFVTSPQNREALIQMQLCQPERIYTLPDITNASPTEEEEAAYRFTVSQALSQIAAWTPLRDWSTEDRTETSSPIAASGTPATDRAAVPGGPLGSIAAALAQLRAAASVTLPDYEVRSPTPIAGPLIAWIRRNLTSHLRQPYFDPILQSQERFNWQVTQTLEVIAQQVAEQRQLRESPPGETEKSTHAEHQRRLAVTAERLLEIVHVLDKDDQQTKAEHVAQTTLTGLRVELEELLADLHSSSAE